MRIIMQPTIDRDERYCDKRCHRCRTVLEISTGDALDNADENGRITIECPVCGTELHLKTFFWKSLYCRRSRACRYGLPKRTRTALVCTG